MRSSCWLLILLLCSCTRIAPWPELVERTIIFERDVPEAYRAAVMSAAEQWNSTADSDLLIADDGKHTCHVFVFISSDLGAPTRLGNTQPVSVDGCSLIVRLRPDMDNARVAMTALHEQGHVLLGSSHSQNEGSVMYRVFIAGQVTDENQLGLSTQHITDEEIERLHARMRGRDVVERTPAVDPLGCDEP